MIAPIRKRKANEASERFGVGKRLEMLRLERGLTRKQVSDAMGIVKETVENYERNFVSQRLDIMELFADFYDVRVGWLYDGYGDKVPLLRSKEHLNDDWRGNAYESQLPKRGHAGVGNRRTSADAPKRSRKDAVRRDA